MEEEICKKQVIDLRREGLKFEKDNSDIENATVLMLKSSRIDCVVFGCVVAKENLEMAMKQKADKASTWTQID